jgi:hypothetical protein
MWLIAAFIMFIETFQFQSAIDLRRKLHHLILPYYLCFGFKVRFITVSQWVWSKSWMSFGMMVTLLQWMTHISAFLKGKRCVPLCNPAVPELPNPENNPLLHLNSSSVLDHLRWFPSKDAGMVPCE